MSSDPGNPEGFQKPFPEGNSPEAEKAMRRNAYCFAAGTIRPDYLGLIRHLPSLNLPDLNAQRILGAELSDEQISVAIFFNEIWPPDSSTLPNVEGNVLRRSYDDLLYLATHGILSLHPLYKGVSPSYNYTGPYEKRKQLLEQDPSGILILEDEIAQIERRAKYDLKKSEGRIPEIQREYREIDEEYKGVPDPDDLFAEEALSRFETDPRFKEKLRLKHQLWVDSGYIRRDENGDFVPETALELRGAKAAFERFKRPLDYYLKHWGKPA